CLWDYEWDSETFYERPVLMARLELTDTSGRKQTIVTDEKWLCGESPVRKQAFWIGELYDANKFQAGWNTPDFKANGWVAARESKIGEKLRKFTFDPMPPEKMSAPIWPVGEKEPKPKVYVFDFGQQIGGRARFAFQNLKKGQRIVVRYSEIAGKDPTPEAGPLAYYDSFDNSKQDPDLLKYKGRGSVASSAFIEIPQPDGTSKREGIPGGAAVFSDMFVSAGEKSETWTPNFTYTGFRYLEILGLESRDQLKEISAYDLSTELNIVGSVDTDEPKLNKILKGAQRTIAVNLHSQFQDNNGSERGSFAFLVAVNDLNASYWINTYPFWHNVALSTVTVNSASNWPVGFCAGLRGPAHGKYKVIGITDSLHYGNLPYNLLAFFNDRKAADALLDWSLVFIKEASAERYWNNKTDGYADHIAETALLDLPGKDKEFIIDGKITSRSLFHGGALSSIADQGIQTATTLGLRAKAEKLRELIEPLKKKLVTTCRDSKTGVWTPDHPSKQGTDTALIYFNIEPREDDKKLCEEIIHEIHTVTNGHQITGSRLSYPLLHVLSQNGFVEEAYRLLMREEYPSLLNMINETNGTIRESWHTRDNFAQIEGLTAMSNWFYSDLVGISADINAPAFASFSLKPIVPSKVGRVNFSFESPRGTIQSLWERKKNEIVWNITVPPNSQAKIAIPSVSVADLKEGGKPISIQPGITSLEKNPEYQFYKIPSGNYQFSYPDAGQKPSQQTDSK
ncbi:MAG: family 78 glycoside hydrolase catalytic domain, partial [bacterium]